jgi:enterochelin esterase-like enzyme
MKLIKRLAMLFIVFGCGNAFAASRDSVIQTSIFSTVLNEDRQIILHLPGNYFYDSGQKYPVMYVLDGTSQDQHTTDKIEILSVAGLIPAAIVVGIPNTRAIATEIIYPHS